MKIKKESWCLRTLIIEKHMPFEVLILKQYLWERGREKGWEMCFYRLLIVDRENEQMGTLGFHWKKKEKQ